MSPRQRWTRTAAGSAILVAVLVVLAITYAGGSAGNEQIFVLFAINLVLAIGIQTFMGLSGVVSFGHVAFMAIGAYAAGLLTTPAALKTTSIPDAPGFLKDTELSFLPATAVAVAFTAVVGLLVGIAIVQLSGTSATIATYALLVIIEVVLVNSPSVTRGNQTFYGLPAETTVGVVLAFAAGAIVAGRCFQDSRRGLLLKAAREDEIGAASSGVDIFRARLGAWVLSIAIVAAAGSLYAHFVTSISPATFSLQLTFTIVTMVILGGRGITGAFAGATVVTIISEAMRRVHGEISIGPIDTEAAVLTPIVLGLLVILTMARRPSGLVGDHEVEELAIEGARRLRDRTDRRPATAEHGG